VRGCHPPKGGRDEGVGRVEKNLFYFQAKVLSPIQLMFENSISLIFQPFYFGFGTDEELINLFRHFLDLFSAFLATFIVFCNKNC
jgi:hypothetical protein